MGTRSHRRQPKSAAGISAASLREDIRRDERARARTELTDLERANRQLRTLYEISKLLTRLEGVEPTMSQLLSRMSEAVPLRTAILILKPRAPALRTRAFVWCRDQAAAVQLDAAKQNARQAHSYLVPAGLLDGLEFESLPWGQTSGASPLEDTTRDADDNGFVFLPLVVEHGETFGGLQIEGTRALEETELVFINAVVNQLAVALDRFTIVQARQADEESRRRSAEADAAEAGRREAEAVVLRARYEALVDNLDNAFVWEADLAAARVSYVSARAETMLGYPRQQWTGQPDFWMTHVHADDRELVRATLRNLLVDRKDQRCDHRCVRFDGQIVWLHTGLHLATGDGTTLTLQAVSIDVTSAKRAENEIREQLDFTRALATSIGEGVLAVDVEERVVFTNRAAEALLGWKESELFGRQFTDVTRVLTKDHADAGNPIEQAMSGLSAYSEEHLLLRKDGRSFPASTSSSPMRIGGHISGAILVFQNISDRKAAEEALREAIRLRERILAVVSHDLRNPLSAIQMMAGVLIGATPELDRRQAQRSKLETIDRSARHMARLIGDITDFANLQGGTAQLKRQAQSPADVVRNACRSLESVAQDKKISLSMEIEDDLPAISCDADRLFQVFSNLIGNAIKVTPKGGAVVLRARRRDHQILFSVSDNGPGILQEDLEMVFQPHWRGKAQYKGSGLGLAIAKGIVRAHGGQIWAESGLGAGATFWFTIPVESPPNLGVAPSSQRSDRVSPILVVDDEDDIRRAMTEILESEGFLVIAAANGSEALQRLEQTTVLPSLILLDLVMPVMDGWTFVVERDKDPGLAPIPIVVISGTHDLLSVAASLHASACLQKPLRAEALVAIAERYARRVTSQSDAEQGRPR